MTGVGSSPALATCETSQVLLAGVSDGFSGGYPIFAHLLIDGQVSLTATVTCNQYYLLSCGADGAR